MHRQLLYAVIGIFEQSGRGLGYGSHSRRSCLLACAVSMIARHSHAIGGPGTGRRKEGSNVCDCCWCLWSSTWLHFRKWYDFWAPIHVVIIWHWCHCGNMYFYNETL